LVSTLCAVLEDELDSKSAREARETAVSWAKKPENLPVIKKFSLALHEKFKSCLKHLNHFFGNHWQSNHF